MEKFNELNAVSSTNEIEQMTSVKTDSIDLKIS